VNAAIFLQATGLALLPTLIWGYFFVSRNPESKRLVLVTFLLGTLAVVPLLLFMDELGAQLRFHELTAGQLEGGTSPGQIGGVLVSFLAVAIVLFGVARLFHFISRRITHQSLRLGALVTAAVLLLLATLSYDQLRHHLGPVAAQFADLFHFLVIFSLVIYVLERFSGRTIVNAVVAALAAVFVLVVTHFDARLAIASQSELSSISTVFSLPFLLDVVDLGPLTLRLLNFLQVYLVFAVIAVGSLLVIAMVHIVYLLHERTWIKVVHVASLVCFAVPFVARAMATVNPDVPLAGLVAAAPPAVVTAWYVNLALLAGLSAWSVYQFLRESGPVGLALFTGLYEEPMNFLGVGVFLTVFVALFYWLGLSVLAFSVVFLAFAEEYSKHLVVRFTDDASIRSIDDAIEFSVIVGLAFAFAENVLLYFPRFLAEQNMAMLLMRSTLTVLMHAVASGIFGYFYGLAHFSSVEVRSGHAARGPVYRVLHRVFLFRREGLYHEAKMFEGLILAGTFHATYNLAASQGQVGIMVGLVAGGSAFLYYLLGQKANRVRIGDIAPERVHATLTGRLLGD